MILKKKKKKEVYNIMGFTIQLGLVRWFTFVKVRD